MTLKGKKGKEHLAQGGISQEKGEERQEEERERRKKEKKGGGGRERIESAGPGQFLASSARGTEAGTGRRGMPRRSMTEAFTTSCLMRAEIWQ